MRLVIVTAIVRVLEGAVVTGYHSIAATSNLMKVEQASAGGARRWS